jgi:NDP-sugar pyrophosphorylase family protein
MEGLQKQRQVGSIRLLTMRLHCTGEPTSRVSLRFWLRTPSLIEGGHLMAYKYEGPWRALDTLRDKQVLEDIVERGEMPRCSRPHAPVSVAS